MSSIEDKYSQSENSFKINFESNFPGYYSNKWENLFFYSNGFLSNFCKDKSIINYLKNPPESDIAIIEKSTSRSYYSFIDEFRYVLNNIKNYETYGRVIFNNEVEEQNFSFAFETTGTNKNLLKHSSFIPQKEIVFKMDPSIKAQIKLDNTEDLFLGKDFNTIDFSKTIDQMEGYESLEEIVLETGGNDEFISKFYNYNNKDFYYNYIKNISEFKKKDFSHNFSNTIGFSVKSLTFNDFKKLDPDLEDIEKYTIFYLSVFSRDKDTYLKHKRYSSVKVELIKNDNENLKTSISDISSTISNECNIMSFEEIQKIIKTYELNDLSEIDFIKNIEYFPGENKIKFNLEYIILNNNINLERVYIQEIMDDDDYNEYHLIHPEIFLNTINSEFKIEHEILSKRSILRSEFYELGKEDEDLVLFYEIDSIYSINIDDIVSRCEYNPIINKNESIFNSLYRLYGKKFKSIDFDLLERKKLLPGDYNLSVKIIFPEDYYSSILYDLRSEYNKNSYDRRSLFEESGAESEEDSSIIRTSTLVFDEDEIIDEDVFKGKSEQVLKISNDKTSSKSINMSKKDKRKLSKKNNISINKKINNMIEEINNIPVGDGDLKEFLLLNNISEENPNGKRNDTGSSYLFYKYDNYDAWIDRRSNIQPRLLKIIEKSFELTREDFPELEKVMITSSGSLPINIWYEIAELTMTNINYIDTTLSEELKSRYKLNLLGDKDKKLKRILRILDRSHGLDLNHALGYAADFYLVRVVNGIERNICLYDPHDNDDFKITKLFLEYCFKLGANNIGAGIDYMAYPRPHRYGITTKKIRTIKSVDKDTNKFIGRIVLDEKGIPLRQNGKSRNCFHVDIINQSKAYNKENLIVSYSDADENGIPKIVQASFEESLDLLARDLFFSEKIVKDIKNKKESSISLDAETSKSLERFTKRFKLSTTKFKVFKPDRKGVWGNRSISLTADTWLLDIAGKTKNTGVYDVESITKENVNEILSKQIKDRYGNKNRKGDEGADELDSVYLEKFKYVEWEDIKK